MRLGDQKAAIDAIMHGTFSTWSSHARAVIEVIFGSNRRAERLQLMKYLITTFNPHALSDKAAEMSPAQPDVQEYSSEFFAETAHRLFPIRNAVMEQLWSDNVAPDEASEKILGFLEGLAEGDERIIGCAMLLRDNLPYTSLPAEFWVEPARVTEAQMKDARFQQAIKKLLSLLQHSSHPAMTIGRVAAIALGIIRSVDDPKMQEALLGEFIHTQQHMFCMAVESQMAGVMPAMVVQLDGDALRKLMQSRGMPDIPTTPPKSGGRSGPN
ncbi:MAG: hypothetical protein Q8P82_03470 [bacterium]|nr:hypothetical protein [bacterium]